MAQSPTIDRAHVAAIYKRPLLELVYEAAGVHRAHHDPSLVQCSSLLNIKTGACPEDCKYCSQSVRYNTELEVEPLMPVEVVLGEAKKAKAAGSDRFCMGAAWRSARKGKDFDRVLEMVREVKALGMETCVTLGMLDAGQASALQEAGLDYYNHNLDTSPEYYSEVITTRTYKDRLDTLAVVRASGIKVCCGGIVGMGETEDDRIGLLHELARQDPPPESVPINALVPVKGTPLGDTAPIPWQEMVRCVATARILMPKSVVRLSAGRLQLSEEAQALCFLAGANSIFLGDRLLTTPNPDETQDGQMLGKLGLQVLAPAGASG